MKAYFRIIDKNDQTKQEYLIEDIIDKNHLVYKSENEQFIIDIFDDGIMIKSIFKDYNNMLVLRTNPYIEINNEYGKLKFYPKVVANIKNNGIIIIVYSMDELLKRIEIEYIGVN